MGYQYCPDHQVAVNTTHAKRWSSVIEKSGTRFLPIVDIGKKLDIRMSKSSCAVSVKRKKERDFRMR